KTLISEQRFGEKVRSSPRTAGDFIAILDTFEGLTETLTLMRDLRFLGRYLPEFRSIQHLARHDHYHKYTVDEHILTALRGLQDLRFGRYQALESQRQAFNGLKKRWVLVLAVLLHDLGKAYREDHDRKSAEIASGVLDRLSVHGEDRERVLFLVQHHQAMSTLSQRRELGDAKVIADFARLVGDRLNLDMLYLLTYADIAAVNPNAWTQWKASLLQDLYLRTVDSLEKKFASAEDERARLEAAKQRVRRNAEERFSPEDIEAFIAVLPEKYLLTASLQKIMDHMDMMKRLPEEGIVLHHRHNIDRGYTELTICAYDAYGMFYRAAGTLSSKNLNILRAQIFTTKNGIMLDTFHITDAEGNPNLYEETWWSVEEELRESLWKKKRPPERGTYAPPRSALPLVEPTVNFDNESSDRFTIIDITARDRIGLLYGITRTLYDLNLDIASAKINTEGEKVIDAFYIADLIGKKITDPGRLERTRRALLEVLR
ncbi:MAG TPA: HD domain-containing protein, partial [Nitrospirota bacterium]|nr:HD domain-containing protein [Nitrospirota bacterium]